MTTYGVIPTGFLRKSLQAILSDLSDAQRATISATLNVSTTSVLGQINGIFARELGLCWEQVELTYHANDPDAVEDLLLTMLCKLTGTVRRPATPSTVTLQCALVSGTTLIAGTHFAAVTGRSDLRWTPKVDFIAGSTATLDVDFVSEQTGIVQGLAGTIAVIATPVSGWTAVSNALDAEAGHSIDDDPTLRQRREDELAITGSTTVRAIAAKLLVGLPEINHCVVLENDTDYTDIVTGSPPHSIEALISDGDPPIVDDDAIAQIVWDNKAGGVQAVGTSSGTAVIDDIGTTKTVAFSRATLKPVYLTFALKVGAGYPGDTFVRDAITPLCNARYGRNDNVIAIAVEAMALTIAGVKDITNFRLGFTASPSGTTNLTIGVREIAIFDSSRIVVSSTT